METIEIEKNVLYGGPDVFNFSPVESLGFLLIDLLKEHKDKVAFIDAITEVQVTYEQILNDSIKTAKCFTAAGLKIGDTIGIVSENRLEFPILLLAAIFVGVAVTPMNPEYTERELAHAFGLSRPKFVFTSPSASKKVVSVASQTNFIKKVIQFGDELLVQNAVLFQDFMKHGKESHHLDFIPATVNIRNQNAIIMYSSGTTGLPKGVQLTHYNLFAMIGSYKRLLMKKAKNMGEVKLLGLLPFFHVFGCLILFGMYVAGGKVIVVPRFQEELYLSCIQKYKITTLYTVPQLMLFLAKHPMVDKYDLSSVIEINCGGAPLSQEIVETIKKRFKGKVNVRQGYGMTETTLSIIAQWTNIRKPGSVGILTQGIYCKVVNPDTGTILGKNQYGELCFKGPLIMKGYIGDEEATHNAIDKDGWLHSGDIGYYDDDYHFFIVDRLKELIKYKGYQVPPAEIEGILLTNPKIKDAAVIGMPDEASGELPMGFVVVQPNVEITEKEVVKYVEDRVSSVKRLRGGVRFLDEIPRSSTGKLFRRELRALLAKSKL